MRLPDDTKTMHKKYLWTLPLLIVAVFFGGAVKTFAGEMASARGWLWGGSETGPQDGIVNGNEAGTGWISMHSVDCDTDGDGKVDNGNCGNIGSSIAEYGVDIPEGDGLLSGYAWSEHYGWISFNESDLGGCFPALARASRTGDTLVGGARILSVRDAGANAGGWTGCISLSGKTYGVQIDSDNKLSGYAWNGETNADGVVEGLGWIDFSGASIVAYKTLKICPSLLTIAQGSVGELHLYYDARVGCNDTSSSAASVDSGVAAWSIASGSGSITLSPKGGFHESVDVTAEATGSVARKTVEVQAAWTPPGETASQTASADVYILGKVVSQCVCNLGKKNQYCSDESYDADELPSSSVTTCTPVADACQGTKTCQDTNKWKEIAPVN
jgi:hypothetical protein